MPHARPRNVSIAIALLVATAPPAVAQQSVPTTRLKTPQATFKESFSDIRGLQELSGGRALVSDGLEEALYLIDFGTGTERKIGRQGGGPGEYTELGPLFRFRGDTTLFLDMGNLRGLLISPSGEIGNTVELRTGSGFPLIPRGADTQGRLYAEPPFTIVNGTRSGSGDLTAIVRWNPRAGSAVDTVATLASGTANTMVVRMGGGGGGGAPSFGGPKPFAPSDGWAVAPDGRVAVVRAADYHVEWIAPDGSHVAGPPVHYEPVKITHADKEAWADRQTQAKIVMRTPEGTRSMHPPRPDPDKVAWPDVKPPFDARGVFVTPDGELWVRRYEPASNENETYDVFNAEGALVKRVTLPEARQLIGFGNGTLYAMHKDDEDLEWLEKYGR